MTNETKPPPPKLVSAGVLLARQLRTDAEVHRAWANQLRTAELMGEWEIVGAIRSELAQTALGLEELADSHAPRE